MTEGRKGMKRFRGSDFMPDPKLARKRRQFKAARLIVRNLPFKSTEESVKQYFSQFGDLAEVKLLRRGDKLIGCGFVQFESKINAAKAITKTSGKPFLGRTIIVDWAIPKNHFLKNAKQTEKGTVEVKEEEEGSIKLEISDSEDPVEPRLKVKEEESDSDVSKDISDTDGSDSDNEDHNDTKSQNSDEEMSIDGSELNQDSEESDGDDPDEDESDSNDDACSDDDVKPNVAKLKKKKSNDVLEGRTVFIKNVPFMATEDELEKAVKKFGPLFYAKICMDPMTEHSKGTAFVKFKTKESADACMSAGTDFTLNGTVLDPHLALPKKELRKKESQPKGPSDSRNLYLLKEGVVVAGSKAAVGVSAADMAKRLQIERWKRQIIKDLGKFVSRTRLVIHNMPFHYNDKKVAAMVKKYCPKNAKFREVRVMRDLKNVDASGVGISKGFAFVTIDSHENALSTLRALNNNPSVFKAQKRPIVSFSVESRKAHKIKEVRLEKSRLPKQVENTGPVIKTEKKDKTKVKKGKGKNEQSVQDESKKADVKFSKKSIPDDEDKEKYSGAFATPGCRKFMNNFSVKRQALLHRKQMRKEKTKTKIKNKKVPRPQRKAIKMENMTRPKKLNEDKDFTSLVNKYKAQMSNNESRKKWFE